MRTIYILLLGGVLCFGSACRKYVEIDPGQIRVLKRTADYQALLYNSTLLDQSYSMPVYSGDDVGTEVATWQNTLQLPVANAFTWSEQHYGTTEEDFDWANLYKQLFTINTVVTQVMDSEGGTTAEKTAVKAAALVHRAYIYCVLVNIYAKAYNPATAAADPGVPLMLAPNFGTNLTRASVAKVYDQIIADLNEAIPSLPDKPDFISNPSKASAYAIMARAYLYKRDFTAAGESASASLAIQNTLLDLNDYKASPTTTFPTRLKNPEELLIKRPGQFPLAMPISADAISMYDQVNDLRYRLYVNDPTLVPGATYTTGRAYFKYRFADGTFIGPSVPEMVLIKAECEARANRLDNAMTLLNTLRRKRYEKSNYNADLSATTADQALHLVVDERKRELVARGFRWFDQRRLAQDPGFVQTVTRVFKGVTYTLIPGSNRYTYPIADKYIQLNPEIIQNPR